MDRIIIEGTEAQAISPEGATQTISLAELFARLSPRNGPIVLADGVKAELHSGRSTIWVHQTPPTTFSFKWISEGSRIPFGRGTRYRTVRVSLPYLIVLAVFTPGPDGAPLLSNANEAFFRNGPLQSLDDPLMFPALLNVSKFPVQENHPLAWICTEHLDRRRFSGIADPGARMRAGLAELLNCLLVDGFNYSSEHHEGSSWYTESRGIDPRIETVDRWAAESKQDALFVLDVPWLDAGHSVAQVVRRIFESLNATPAGISSAGDVARVIFNSR